jgi:hypothetical protein
LGAGYLGVSTFEFDLGLPLARVVACFRLSFTKSFESSAIRTLFHAEVAEFAAEVAECNFKFILRLNFVFSSATALAQARACTNAFQFSKILAARLSRRFRQRVSTSTMLSGTTLFQISVLDNPSQLSAGFY